MRPDLKPHDRSLITVSALVATGQSEQIPAHLRRAMDNGFLTAEIDPLLNHLAYFTGWPKVFPAMRVIDEALRTR